MLRIFSDQHSFSDYRSILPCFQRKISSFLSILKDWNDLHLPTKARLVNETNKMIAQRIRAQFIPCVPTGYKWWPSCMSPLPAVPGEGEGGSRRDWIGCHLAEQTKSGSLFFEATTERKVDSASLGQLSTKSGCYGMCDILSFIINHKDTKFFKSVSLCSV